ESRFWIDEAEHHRVERAGDAGQPGAQHEGVELGAACGSAERARRTFGILDGAEIKSHPAVCHPPGDAERDHENREEQIVIGECRYEREIEDVSWNRRTAQP